MSTTYDEIRDCFLKLITDFDLLSLEEDEINDIVNSYMSSATARFSECVVDLHDRDDDLRLFKYKLLPLEKEILAHYMILSWLSPQLLHQQKLQINIGTKDYISHSPANQLKEMREVLLAKEKDVKDLINEYYYLTYLGDDRI